MPEMMGSPFKQYMGVQQSPGIFRMNTTAELGTWQSPGLS